MNEPHVLAMVLCRQEYTDPDSGNVSLLGLVSFVSATAFPTRVARLVIYLAFTECEGEVPLQVRLVNRDGDDMIEPAEGMAAAPGRLDTVEVVFQLDNIDLDGPGEYFVQAFASGALLMERRLFVLDSSQTGDNDEG